MDALNMKANSLSTYKISLSKKGLINPVERGVVSLTLPRFKEFVKFYENFE